MQTVHPQRKMRPQLQRRQTREAPQSNFESDSHSSMNTDVFKRKRVGRSVSKIDVDVMTTDVIVMICLGRLEL